MRNIVSAEYTKLLPHKGTWFLVWIYPILFLAILTIGIFAEPGMSKSAAVAEGWINETVIIWSTSGFTLGRYLVAAYFALVFAGEYGWNTLKLVLPHTPRWKLAAAKYVVASGLLYLAWIIAAVMTVIAEYIKTAQAGLPVPTGVTIGAILNGHWHAILLSLTPFLLTAGYASVLAVLTRSTLAAFIVSLVLITLDDLLGKLVMWLSSMGGAWLAVPYQALPGYHLDNFMSFMVTGQGKVIPLANGTVIAASQTTSTVMIFGWIIALIGFTFWWFRRQDVN